MWISRVATKRVNPSFKIQVMYIFEMTETDDWDWSIDDRHVHEFGNPSYKIDPRFYRFFLRYFLHFCFTIFHSCWGSSPLPVYLVFRILYLISHLCLKAWCKHDANIYLFYMSIIEWFLVNRMIMMAKLLISVAYCEYRTNDIFIQFKQIL